VFSARAHVLAKKLVSTRQPTIEFLQDKTRDLFNVKLSYRDVRSASVKGQKELKVSKSRTGERFGHSYNEHGEVTWQFILNLVLTKTPTRAQRRNSLA